MKRAKTEANEGRDPALYKCKVLMENSQPLVAPTDLPSPRFPRELSKAEQEACKRFTLHGHVADTNDYRDYKHVDSVLKRWRPVGRSRTGLFTRYQAKDNDVPQEEKD